MTNEERTSNMHLKLNRAELHLLLILLEEKNSTSPDVIKLKSKIGDAVDEAPPEIIHLRIQDIVIYKRKGKKKHA